MAIDHSRIRIKKYLQQLLKNQDTIAGDNIHLNRPINLELAPAEAEVRILSLNSTSDARDHTPRIYKQTYLVSIEISYAPKMENYSQSEEDFELLVSEIEDAIESDEKLTQTEILAISGDFCVEDTFLSSIDFRTEEDGARPIFVAIIAYSVFYNKRTGASTDDLEDLQTIKYESTPSGGTDDTPSVDSEVYL